MKKNINKKIAIIFPKDSESIFNKKSTMTFGGATVQLYQIAKELNTYNNLQIFGIINEYNDLEKIDFKEFPLVKTFKNTDSIIRKIWLFHCTIKKCNPDVIIQRGLTIISCFIALYCKIIHINFIFMFAHNNEIIGRYQRTNRRCKLFFLLLRYSSILICQSEDQQNTISKKYLHKTKIIKSGYEIKSGKKINKEFILWVGRLEKWKQPKIFLDIARSIPNEYFVMIAPEDPTDPDLAKKIINESKSLKNLKFIDFINFHEIDLYFKKAKLFINTSDKEGFPNTFIQSCKNFTPIVSLNINPDNFLEKYKVGFHCNNDLSYMIEKIEYLLSHKKIYSDYQTNAFNYAKTNNSIKKNVKLLLEQIYSLF